MTYLIYGYIFIGVCYATAAWIALSTDPSNKELMDAFKNGPILGKILVALALVVFAAVWPSSLTVKLLVRFFRKGAPTTKP